MVLWRTNKPEKLKKEFVKSLLHSKPIEPKHKPPKSIGANIPSLVTNDDRAFFNDFVDFGAVVNWWFADEDNNAPWRLQELPDTELKIDFSDSPDFGRRYDIFHNQVKVGALEVSPGFRYALDKRNVYAKLEVQWVRLLSFHAIHEFLGGIALHICNNETTGAQTSISHAISKVLWNAQQIDQDDLGTDYGDWTCVSTAQPIGTFNAGKLFRSTPPLSLQMRQTPTMIGFTKRCARRPNAY